MCPCTNACMHIHLVIMQHGKIYESLTSHPVTIHTMNEKNIARDFFKKDDRQPNKIPCRRTEVLQKHRPPSHRTSTKPSGGREAGKARNKSGQKGARRSEMPFGNLGMTTGNFYNYNYNIAITTTSTTAAASTTLQYNCNCNCNYSYNSTTLHLQLQLQLLLQLLIVFTTLYTTLDPAVVVEVTTATTPKSTTPTNFWSINGFALPSMHYNKPPLL